MTYNGSRFEQQWYLCHANVLNNAILCSFLNSMGNVFS